MREVGAGAGGRDFRDAQGVEADCARVRRAVGGGGEGGHGRQVEVEVWGGLRRGGGARGRAPRGADDEDG